MGPISIMENYEQKIRQEISNYKVVENVHDLPEIAHYVNNRYLAPKLAAMGLKGFDDFYVTEIEKLAKTYPCETIEILSIGTGNCDLEVRLGQLLEKRGTANWRFHCLDLNPHMLERGKGHANESGLAAKFEFICTDINGWKAQSRQYHVVIANQSLHHFLELELLFGKISEALVDQGVFLTHDMIGRNGHMRWPEALDVVNVFWGVLEDRYKYNQQLRRQEPQFENWDCSQEGFEGIRAQDILPLLLRRFNFEFFLGFGNIVDIFIDRSFGHNFDRNSDKDRCFIDLVVAMDEHLIESGQIKPTHMLAAMTKRSLGTAVRVYKHLTPEFCVRMPERIGEYYGSS